MRPCQEVYSRSSRTSTRTQDQRQSLQHQGTLGHASLRPPTNRLEQGGLPDTRPVSPTSAGGQSIGQRGRRCSEHVGVPVVRIDRPMVGSAVVKGGRGAVMVAVASTMTPPGNSSRTARRTPYQPSSSTSCRTGGTCSKPATWPATSTASPLRPGPGRRRRRRLVVLTQVLHGHGVSSWSSRPPCSAAPQPWGVRAVALAES
jgi:hypothetical protein